MESCLADGEMQGALQVSRRLVDAKVFAVDTRPPCVHMRFDTCLVGKEDRGVVCLSCRKGGRGVVACPVERRQRGCDFRIQHRASNCALLHPSHRALM